MAFHISLESFQQRLQLCFKPHLNWRSAQNVTGFQNDESFNFGKFETPNLGVLGKMAFRCNPHGQSQRILEGGKWWLPPSLSYGEFCEFMYACGLFVHQKCFDYALTNVLFGLCMSKWIIDLLVTHPSPHFKTLTPFFTPKVL